MEVLAYVPTFLDVDEIDKIVYKFVVVPWLLPRQVSFLVLKEQRDMMFGHVQCKHVASRLMRELRVVFAWVLRLELPT